MSVERNLILVSEERHMDPADFVEIASRIRARCEDIEVFIADNAHLNSRLARNAQHRPSLIVCPTQLDQFAPRRGRIFQGRWIGKVDEMHRMETQGIPVPKWTIIEPTTRLDETEWGPAVIVKPSLGGGNRDITLMPTAAVSYRSPETFPEDHRGRISPMIAQRYVNTGRLPVEYRVLTLLGRPLYAIRQQSIDGDLIEWPPSGKSVERADVSSKGRRRKIEFTDDPELLTLATKVHDAMPDVATVACDIVRDIETGHPFVIEANTKGWGWRLSSPSGRLQQMEGGLDFYSQFDALTVAAEVLIEKTRQLAT